MGNVVVAIAVSERTARRQVTDAAQMLGAKSQQLRQKPDGTPAESSPCDLLVYDLGPWNETALAFVRRFRARYPRRPILLYHPRSRAAFSLATRISVQLGVLHQAQDRHVGTEVDWLAYSIAELLATVPELLLRQIVGHFLAHTPAPVRRFADAAIDRCAAGGHTVPKVGGLRRRLGFGERKLERAAAHAALPPPRRLLRWLVLLYACADAEWNQRSLPAAAQRMGLGEKTWWRLRADLLPGTTDPGQRLLEIALLGFAAECGIPRSDAQRLVRLTKRA